MKKYLLSLLMIASLVPMHETKAYYIDMAHAFVFGYRNILTGFSCEDTRPVFDFLRTRSTPVQCAFVAGVAAGSTILGLALYGLKKLIIKDKKAIQKEAQQDNK
jgi:hypothetical protein